MGRPHPSLHRSRPIENFSGPASIASEDAGDEQLSSDDDDGDDDDNDDDDDEDLDDEDDDGVNYDDNDDDIVEDDDDDESDEHDDGRGESFATEVMPKLGRSIERCSESRSSRPRLDSSRPKTVSQSWTSTFSYDRTSSGSDPDPDKFHWEEESQINLNLKNLGSVQNFSSIRGSSVKPRPESVQYFRPEPDPDSNFGPENEAEIRLRATSLRALRKKLRDGAIDVSKFDSYQQLKIFQAFLRGHDEVVRPPEKPNFLNEPLERVKREGRPKFHTPPPPSMKPERVEAVEQQPHHHRQQQQQRQQQYQRASCKPSPRKSAEMFDSGALCSSQLHVASMSAMPSLATLHSEDFATRKASHVTPKRSLKDVAIPSHFHPKRHQINLQRDQTLVRKN